MASRCAAGRRNCGGICRTEKTDPVYHDFSGDIIAAARIIAERYRCDKKHSAILEKNVLNLFDSMKKYHGLGKRERLLLQISAILHDCGKYISMRTPGECAYNIILSTEIIGISHKEREIIANVVKYNTLEFDYTADSVTLDKQMRITIAKLTAILKIGNAIVAAISRNSRISRFPSGISRW